MTADPRAHRARPWRVHSLASDFDLLDLWEVPLDADPARGEDFAAFLRVFTETTLATHRPVYSLRPRSLADAVHAARLGGMMALVAFRQALGRVFALDDGTGSEAIPGCRESRVRDRLDAADRARDTGLLPGVKRGGFSPVYAFADEALLEVGNKTIHALLHLSWVEEGGRGRVVLAVYVKSRGWQSRAYMALIKPFRHWIVYPAWIEHLTRTWRAERASAPAYT